MQKYNIFFKYTTLHRQIDQLLGLEERFGEVAAEGEHLRLVLERGQLGGQITALKADNPVGECISLLGGDVSLISAVGGDFSGSEYDARMKELEIFHEVIHVSVSRGIDLMGETMFKPENAVFIIVGGREKIN